MDHFGFWRLYNVDCELYLLLSQWLSNNVYRCTLPATITNPHIVRSLGSKETHIQSHNRGGSGAPSGVQRQSPWSKGQGRSPLKLKAFRLLDV